MVSVLVELYEDNNHNDDHNECVDLPLLMVSHGSPQLGQDLGLEEDPQLGSKLTG